MGEGSVAAGSVDPTIAVVVEGSVAAVVGPTVAPMVFIPSTTVFTVAPTTSVTPDANGDFP